MDEPKETKKEESTTPTEKPYERGKSKTDEEVERINADTERIRISIAENENIKARAQISGTTDSGQKVEDKKEETPKEYNDRIDKEMSEGKHNE